MALIGKPIDRIDGRLKITGAAKYSAEFKPDNMVYGYPLRSTVANGTVNDFNIEAAERCPGFITFLSYKNAPKLRPIDPAVKTGGTQADFIPPLQENRVNYFGQYIGIVVAETYEQARAAVNLITVSYTQAAPAINLKRELPKGTFPQDTSTGTPAQLNSGKAAPVLAAAPVKFEQVYQTSNENHHPMETHATLALWEGTDRLTLYDSTQAVTSLQRSTAYLFYLKPEQVQVMAYYIGGGFGSKGPQWGHITLAAMAAKVVNRPVKLVLTRQMMQTNTGRRPQSIQTISLGADQAGNLTAIRHHSDSYKNLTTYFENTGSQTEVLYKAPVHEITHRVTSLNVGPPSYMRAPGEEPGTFPLESAVDELAYQLGKDPLAFRVLNHTATEPISKLPFSGDNLLECYAIGAERFGWFRRSLQPRQQRNGRYWVGYGMATATYPALRNSTAIKIQLLADGSAKVMSAVQDIGTGTYTIMAQTAGDALGLPIEKITILIGDSSLPPGAASAGSRLTATITPAVFETGVQLRTQLLDTALADKRSPLSGRKPDEVAFGDGRFFLRDTPSVGDTYVDILRRSNQPMLEVCALSMPASGPGQGPAGSACPQIPYGLEENSNDKKYSFHSFGAQFAEVWVDEDLGTVRVKRFVSVMDIGQLMNEKTIRSQIIGGIIYGIGSALMEKTEYDERYANPVERTLADYHVPVHLDIPAIDVQFIGKPDYHLSPLGARGGGEIGTVGVTAAIANAVFNATGQRIRELPLTPDKLVGFPS